MNNEHCRELMAKRLYTHFEEIIGSILLVVMCVVTILQVASRYLLRAQFAWSEELATILFVWVVFIGAALALKKGEHFGVDIIVDKLPARFEWVARIVASLLVIVFTLLITWYGYDFAARNAAYTTPVLEVSRAVPYAAIPAGGALMLIRAIEMLVHQLRLGPMRLRELKMVQRGIE